MVAPSELSCINWELQYSIQFALICKESDVNTGNAWRNQTFNAA